MKIAQIVNETPDFGWSYEGCTPCECGDGIACLQEQFSVLAWIPSDVLGYVLLFGIVVLFVLIIGITAMIISRIVRRVFATLVQKKI